MVKLFQYHVVELIYSRSAHIPVRHISTLGNATTQLHTKCVGKSERKMTSDGEVMERISGVGGIYYSLELQGQGHVSLTR